MTPLFRRRCRTRTSLRIWTATSRARQSAGRSSLRVRRQKRKSFHRSGRTRMRCRSCAWCELWDRTVWPTPFSKQLFAANAFTARRRCTSQQLWLRGCEAFLFESQSLFSLCLRTNWSSFVLYYAPFIHLFCDDFCSVGPLPIHFSRKYVGIISSI